MPYVCPKCGTEWGVRSKKLHRMCPPCRSTAAGHYVLSESTRTCTDCGQTQPRGKYARVDYICPSCLTERSRVRRNAQRRTGDPQFKDTKILWMYGISATDYESMLASQGGGCAICSAPPEPDRRLHVDHDHRCCPGRRSCGQCVRGLLCRHCNLALGQFGDDPNRVAQAAEYLKRRSA